MSNTGDLEREVEASRERIEATVDAIKEKMSVGQMFDEMSRFMREHGGSEMASNLGRQVKENPLPLALVGAGIAMLMFGRGRGRTNGYASEYPYGEDAYAPSRDEIGARVGSAMHAAGSGFSAAAHGVSDAGYKAADAASSVAHGVGSAASRVAGAAQHATDALRSSAGHAAAEAGRLGQTVGNVLSQDPLILGAIGLGVGAAIGALLPPTEIEDRMFGETRDRLAKDAERLAAEGMEKVETVAKETYETVKTEAERTISELTGDGEARQTI